MRVSKVSVGWKRLETILNGIVDAVNTNEPIAGSGINLEINSSGTMISATSQGSQPGDSSGGGTTVVTAPTGAPTEGGWVTITLVNPVDCSQQDIQVWSKPV